MAKINESNVMDIVEGVGGKDNISAATHCVTRLRFALKDESKVDKEKLEANPLVKGAFSANGQYQVVIGAGTVDKVYQKMTEVAGIGESSKQDVKDAAADQQNWLKRLIKTLADIFIPIVPVIVMAGLLLGINNMLTGNDIFFDGSNIVTEYPQWAGIADMINVIANTAFTFLPALIGWSAMTRFGGSPLLGVVLGLILVHPSLLSAWAYASTPADEIPVWDIFGMDVQKLGYQGQVLPMLFASYILAKLEALLKRVIPDSIQLLVVVPVSLLVVGFLSFVFIGPVAFTLGGYITDGFTWLFDNYAVVAGLLYGALYAPLVMTGMHHTFLAVDLQLSAAGGTPLWPILALSNVAQGAAAIAIIFVTTNKNLKSLSGTSALSAFLGVTEPAMFGINLRFMYPFIMALVGSSIAGMFIAVNGVVASSVGVGGIPAFFSIPQNFWAIYAIAMAICLIVPFILTFLYGRIATRFTKSKA
ncbi:PTS system trehalose-specific EIIBC component [Aureibacillus halotolerans]|uniref:PTS system trehalose-specific IIB component (Glc family) /PTS system trehalose-specific IIC component (Glc family) n=1 Tax=Aureibacillus halotolerans TaxID=1508390 RepID=A0A4R6TXE9_9BACI|nr:PTS system trehalose-specific EIIBC component [Aureibacillus halotolerans]TDQ37452.1 PTS system trehalose-specific IIB component (Glc family) /PTS system trehalose-specific IIC component (Glc family) [Aureibacillus halotolerans]